MKKIQMEMRTAIPRKGSDLVIDAMRADDDPDPRLDTQIDALTSVLEQQGRHAEMIEQLSTAVPCSIDVGALLFLPAWPCLHHHARPL